MKIEFNLTALRRRAYHDQNKLCYWCRQEMSWPPSNDPSSATADHLIPLHNGGKTKPGNIVASCRKCNNGRHPYLNKDKLTNDNMKATAGDDTAVSPFEVLRS